MKQRITIGILGEGAGWRILLDQIGVNYEQIVFPDNFRPADYSAIIVNASPKERQFEPLLAYLRDGGAVLDCGHFLPMFKRNRFNPCKIKSVTGESNNDVFNDVRLLDIYQRGKIYNEAQFFEKTVFLGEIDGGPLAYLAFDIDRLFLDTRKARKQFYTPFNKYPHEWVSLTSKNEARKLVTGILKWLHFQRNLPFVHRWHFPGKARNIFGFRIDSDGANQKQVQTWYDIAADHDIKMTWFLHGGAHRNWISYFRNFGAQEIAVHGYKHFTYETVDENRENMLKGKALLEEVGINSEGFAAPFGEWNPALGKVLQELGFAYSSEFTLDYDNLPFYPANEDGLSPVLQVPIHPVCIGNFIRLHAAPGQMLDYFRAAARRKLQFNEPLIFYDHPVHEFHDVVAKFFDFVGDLELPNLTMGEYARWWKHRQSASFEALADGDELGLDFRDSQSDVALAVWTRDNRHKLIDSPGVYQLSKMQRLPDVHETQPAPGDLKKLRKFNPRLAYYSLLDSYWRREK